MILIIGKKSSFLALESLNDFNMKKKVLIFLLLFPAVFYSQTFGIMTTDTNSRRTCGGEQLRVIKKGQIVEILDTKGSCSFVRDITANKSGWVKKRLINKVAITRTESNSRRSCGGEQLRVIPKGQVVEILDTKSSCYFVRDVKANKSGWVQATLLSKNIFNSFSDSNTRINNNNISQNNVITKDIVPNCDYSITSPINGSNGVMTNLTIKWKHGTGSPKGYYFTIASNINGKREYLRTQDGKLIRQLNIGYVNSYSTPKLKPFTTYNIGILPYNDTGLVNDCYQLFSFTTGSSTTSSSPLKVIENRMTNMGLNSKWNVFKRGMNNEKIKISNVKEFLAEVASYEGTPYSNTGGLTRTSGIDCSGLIYKGLIANGYRGQRLSAQMLAQSGALIANKYSLKPGDLVAFAKTTNENKLVTHIGIYFGNNRFLHSSSSKGVIYSDINDPYYWGDKFIFGVRF